jgi:methionyl-tRNA synthetase
MRMLQIAKTFEDEKDSYNFTNYLGQISGLVAATDAYLTAEAPWKLAKLNDERSRERLKRILFIAASSIRLATICFDPFMPLTTSKVWAQLGFGSTQLTTEEGQLTACPPGTKLGPLAPIFPRADKGLAQIMTDMENPTTPAAAEPAKPAADPSAPTAEALNAVSPGASASPATPRTSNLEPGTSTITIDDFAKIDLRVAQIVVAERIPKAAKLLRLEVDLGPNFDPPRRQILAGIAEYYAPETLIGRKVVIVANLVPRKMRGLESQGMIVAAAVGPNGAPVLAGFLEDVEIGSRLK